MGLFGSPRIEGEALKRCLEYLRAEAKVVAAQAREVDIYSSTMVQFGKTLKGNPSAMEEMYKAAKRLVQASTDILREHHEIKDVPDEAMKVREAWRATLRANAIWAITAAEEIEEMMSGTNPDWGYVQKLIDDYDKARAKAEAEDKKFLKRMRINAEEMAGLVDQASSVESATAASEKPTK